MSRLIRNGVVIDERPPEHPGDSVITPPIHRLRLRNQMREEQRQLAFMQQLERERKLWAYKGKKRSKD